MKKIKTYKRFTREIRDILEDYYKDNAIVEITEVLKTNGKRIEGINVVLKDDPSRVSPIIYLDGFFDDYNKGKTIHDCIREINKLVDEHQSNSKEVNGFDSIAISWEQAKDRIYPVLINTESNKELLRNLVSFPFLDLSIIFVVRGEITSTGYKSVKVTKELIEKGYKVDAETLKEQAFNNMKKDNYKITSMFDMVKRLMGSTIVSEDEHMILDNLYVLTNQDGVFGAAGMLYNEYLNEILDEDAYLIPSSINELIIVKDTNKIGAEELSEMIQSVNETVVEQEARLSSHPYYYDSDTKSVRMCA